MPPVSTDEHGVVRGFPYHDGFLDGVLLDGRDVRLVLRSVDGERRILTLVDVERLCVTAFREGNIVSTIWALSPAPAVADGWVRERIADRLTLDLAGVAADRTVFVLETAMDGDVVAICRSVEIGGVGDTLLV